MYDAAQDAYLVTTALCLATDCVSALFIASDFTIPFASYHATKTTIAILA